MSGLLQRDDELEAGVAFLLAGFTMLATLSALLTSEAILQSRTPYSKTATAPLGSTLPSGSLSA